jgi:hypothetical protein
MTPGRRRTGWSPPWLSTSSHDGCANGKLRHPSTFVGMRNDLYPRTVHREAPGTTAQAVVAVSTWAPPPAPPGKRVTTVAKPLATVLRQLDAIEASGGAGTLTLPDGFTLAVTGVAEVFWLRAGITKCRRD